VTIIEICGYGTRTQMLAVIYRAIMKHFLLISLFFCITRIIAQDNKSVEFILKVHPLALINPDRPSVQGSVETKFFNRVGVEYTYGFRYFEYMATIWNYDTLSVSPKGNNMRYEIKAYRLFFNDLNMSDFITLGYWHIDDSRNKKTRYYDKNEIKTDYFGLMKNTNVYAIGYGVIKDLDRFTLEGSINIGVRRTKTNWKNNEFDIDKHIPYGDLYSWEYPGDRWFPHINLSLKMGINLFYPLK
jgi:hypothetical protein